MSRWTIRCAALCALAALGIPKTAPARALEVAAGSFIKGLMGAMATEFERQTPGAAVTLIVGSRDDDELAQDVLRRALVGAGVPDIIVAGNHTRLLAARKLAVPLDPLLAGRPGSPLRTASPVVLDKGRIGSVVYGAAFGLSLPVVLFNAELVRRAGGDPAALPRDWPDILDLARRIDGLGPPIVGGFMEADNTGALTLLALLQSQGGRMMDPQETRLTIDTPEGLAGLAVPQGFAAAGQARAAMSRDQARQAFSAGAIGVLSTMSSVIPALEAGARGSFAVVSVPYPVVPDRGTLPSAGPVASILAADPAQQALALDFIEFMIGPKGQSIVAATTGYSPINEPAIAAAPDLRRLLAARPNAHAYLDRLPVATGWYVPPGDNPARIARITTDHMLDLVSARAKPLDAMQALVREITPLLPVSR